MASKAIEFSQSRVGTWRRCRQRYDWKYVQHLPERASEGQYRGRCGHKALEQWYIGTEPAAAVAAGLMELGPGQVKDVERMRAILTRYFKWAALMDEHDWQEVIGTEVSLHGEIDGHKIMGIADLIVRTKTGIAIVDHKFSANGTLEGALQSPQLSMYGELALQVLGEMPEFLIYNTVRTTVTGQAMTNPVLRYKARIVPERHQLWKDEFAAQAEEIDAFHKGGAGAPRRYRNQTKDCGWDCAFYGRCLALDRGEEYVEVATGQREDLTIVDDVTQG